MRFIILFSSLLLSLIVATTVLFDFSAIPRKFMFLELAVDMQGPRPELWQSGREEMIRHGVGFHLIAFEDNEQTIKLKSSHIDNIIGATICFQDLEHPLSRGLARAEFLKTRPADENYVVWRAPSVPLF
jgi:hypothetical protein